MLVIVRLFARLREITGRSELPFDVPAGSDVRALWDDVVAVYPDLAAYRASISCAVNEDYAKFTTRLTEGDEVAFLPPVSGG